MTTANRRLCNQAFFTVVSIDDGEPQIAYRRPFEALCGPQVQGSNALTWATAAKKKGEPQTRTGAVPLVGV